MFISKGQPLFLCAPRGPCKDCDAHAQRGGSGWSQNVHNMQQTNDNDEDEDDKLHLACTGCVHTHTFMAGPDASPSMDMLCVACISQAATGH